MPSIDPDAIRFHHSLADEKSEQDKDVTCNPMRVDMRAFAEV